MNKPCITGKTKNKSSEGSILLSVLVVFVVILSLVLSASSIALSNNKKAKKDSENHSSYYVAESGINEFVDLMVDHLSNLSKADRKTYSEMTSEELSETLNLKINEKLRKNIDFDKANVERDVKIQFNKEDTDSYKIISSASVNGESRTLQLEVEDLLLSLKPSDKPATDFLSKYGLVIKNKAHLGSLTSQGSIFLMTPNPNKSLIKFNRNTNLQDYKDKESYLYHPTELDLDSYSKAIEGYEWESIDKEKFKNRMKKNEIPIQEPIFQMPKAPLNGKEISEDQISTLNYSLPANYVFDKGSLTWNQGHGVLKLKDETSYLSKLDIRSKDFNAMKSILYIDVGNENRNLVIDDFKITGGLIVKGSGSLNIYTTMKEDIIFNPHIFKGQESDNQSGRNSLVFVANGNHKLTIKPVDQVEAFIEASFIANDIGIQSGGGMKLSVNIIALGGDSNSENPSHGIDLKYGSFRHGNLDEDSRRVFIFYPNGQIRVEGIQLNGFVYANDLIVGGSNVTVRHDPDLINDLPPLIEDIINDLNILEPGDPSGNDDNVDTVKIKFGKMREVSQ